mgnify:CR=1 FL=1
MSDRWCKCGYWCIQCGYWRGDHKAHQHDNDEDHHLRTQLDALQDAVNDLTATTGIKHVIGGPPFLFPLDGICNVEVRDEDGVLAGASGVTVMCAVVDDGRTLKLILSGPTTTDGAA